VINPARLRLASWTTLFINLQAKEDRMKLTTAAFCGAVFGLIFISLPSVVEIWRHEGGYEIIKWIMTAIAFLAVPVGAICGAAFAALINWKDKGPSR
jgi:hypothetical protein